jgi:hypothetical protein
MSGTADVTSGIQKKYLTVDSAHFRGKTFESADDPYLNIQLPEPIHHVHEVALQMAVVPNEFFNIRTDNNKLAIGWRRSEYTPSIAEYTQYLVEIQIPIGLYTLDLLVAAINTAVTAASFKFPGGTNPPVFGRVSSSKATDTKVTSFSQTTTLTITTDNAHMALVHPAYATPGGAGSFRNSIAHRLGFTRQDVIVVDQKPTVTGSSQADWYWTNAPSEFNLQTLAGLSDVERVPIIYSSTNSLPNMETAKSVLSGTETYDALHVHCDLLSNSTMATGNIVTGTYPTPITVHRTDILATVPVNANIGSVVRYTRPSEHYFGHAINSHRPITHFKLWLTDDSGIPIRPSEMSDWLAVLEFTIVEHVPDIVRQVQQLNQNKAFQSRHMPMHLV